LAGPQRSHRATTTSSPNSHDQPLARFQPTPHSRHRLSYPHYFLQGALDEIMLFDRALADEEIAAL
jgi:hypothetical protein